MATAKERSALAKMSPGRKRAFRAMIAARRLKAKPTTKRRRRKVVSRGGGLLTAAQYRELFGVSRKPGRRRKNPGGKTMHALVANPGQWPPRIKYKRKRRKTAKRRTTKRRRRASGTAPRRRRKYTRARRPRRKLHRVGRVRVKASKRRVRGRYKYRSKTLYSNPRRRRRNPRRARGFMGALKQAFTPYASGFVMSMITSVTDVALAKMPAVKGFSKIALAGLTVLLIGRKYPYAAAGAIGSLAASSGYVMGTRLAGGAVIQKPEDTEEELGRLAHNYPNEMGALLSGMGVLTGPTAVEPAVAAYESALSGLGDDDDE